MTCTVLGALPRPQSVHQYDTGLPARCHASPCVAVPDLAELPSGVEGDNFALFLALLSFHTSLSAERRSGHWINFHNDKLRGLMGGKYRQRVNQMIEAGWIERNDRYSTGHDGGKAFTKSYRLSEQHRTGRFQVHWLISKPAIRKAFNLRDPDPENLRPAGMHYHRSFEQQFAIDPNAAFDSSLKCHWDQWTITKWLNRETFSQRCAYGRYHSLMTQLPRRMRRHITTVDGEHLAMVDVSSCQPLLLGMLAGQHHGGRSSDVGEWIDLCQRGEFYGYFREAIQSDSNPTVKMTLKSGQVVSRDLRDGSARSLKRATLVQVFDKVAAMERSPIFRIIERDFPTIAAFIRWAKRERYQELACQLQRAESNLMVDQLGSLMIGRYPDVAVQTIHDAVVVPVAFASKANELVREVFAAKGLQPKTKTELLQTT